ncbi:MAG: hypothetical protein BGO98_30705 [Myxococcales bacterium 68-20]|nr:MAG: hypothetical protein BGO98_30705 [Myxococcales bacterium 68-20]
MMRTMNRRIFALSTGLIACFISACSSNAGTTESSLDAGDSPEAAADAGASEAGPIAPECEESFCAQVDVSAKLQCHDAVSNKDFSMTTSLSGRTTEVTCDVEDKEGGGQDLRIGVRPGSATPEDASEAWLRIRSFTGPGTYPLVHVKDEGSHQGFELSGKATSSEGHQTVGTLHCLPSPCEAVVAPETEPVPNDPGTVKEWRVRLEVRCAAGGTLSNMHCESDARTVCTFDEAPTLRFDVACRK